MCYIWWLGTLFDTTNIEAQNRWNFEMLREYCKAQPSRLRIFVYSSHNTGFEDLSYCLCINKDQNLFLLIFKAKLHISYFT